MQRDTEHLYATVDDIVIKFKAYVVPFDFLLLLGLVVLRKLKLLIDFDYESLSSKHED